MITFKVDLGYNNDEVMVGLPLLPYLKVQIQRPTMSESTSVQLLCRVRTFLVIPESMKRRPRTTSESQWISS